MIDTHVHFWQLARGDYAWINESRPILNSDYLPDNFIKAISGTNVKECIAVQAAPTEEESRFLLDLAQNCSQIVGVTGWLDLTNRHVSRHLERLAADFKLVGIRPMAGVSQGEKWLNTPVHAKGFKLLATHNLVLEALALTHHLNAITEVAKSFPELRIVINHAAKPETKDIPRWINDIRAMTGLENTYCKVSGFTQQSSDSEHHQYVFDTLISVFGASRLVWGSDFPVLLETTDYKSWIHSSEQLWTALSADEINQIKHGTASRLYQLAG